jgi:hypothetical protein
VEHLSIYLSIYGTTAPVGPLPLFQFLNLYTFHRTPWTGEQPVARPLPTHRTTQTQNKRPQTSMSRVGLERTIPGFQRTETVHALDRTATVIDKSGIYARFIKRQTVHDMKPETVALTRRADMTAVTLYFCTGPRNRVSWLRCSVIFFTSPIQIPKYYLYYATTVSF